MRLGYLFHPHHMKPLMIKLIVDSTEIRHFNAENKMLNLDVLGVTKSLSQLHKGNDRV